MKKILFISNEGSYTGAPIFLAKLVRHIKEKANYKPSVLFAKPGPLTQLLENEGIEVFISEKSSINFSITQKIIRRLSHYLRYIKLLLLDRPDLIYSNTIVNFGEVILAGLLRIPVLLHMHEGQGVANHYIYRLRLACFFANKIIVGSSYVNEALFSITRKKGEVIYIGVLPRGNISNKNIKNEKPTLLGIIGTINPNKGQHVAIDAVRILLEKGMMVQLIIAGVSGDDTYLQEVKNLVNKNSLNKFVKLIGAVPSAEEFIQKLDLLLVPSFDEALPTVILEAFSLGIPVVASNVGGIPEMIENGSSGFLFQAGNSEMLATCLEKIIGDNRQMEVIAMTAREVVRNKFDVNINNTRIEKRLNEMLQ